MAINVQWIALTAISLLSCARSPFWFDQSFRPCHFATLDLFVENGYRILKIAEWSKWDFHDSQEKQVFPGLFRARFEGNRVSRRTGSIKLTCSRIVFHG